MSQESELFRAKTTEEWNRSLETLYVKPASRRQLSKDLRERYVVRSFLSEAGAIPILLPLILIKRERPDFRLVTPYGDIGIEVTSVTNRALEIVRNEMDDLARAGLDGQPVVWTTTAMPFRGSAPDGPKSEDRTSESELIGLAAKVGEGPGYQGLEPEGRMTHQVGLAWDKKHEAYRCNEVQRCGRDILLIYYNGDYAGDYRWSRPLLARLAQERSASVDARQEAWLYAHGRWLALR